MPEWRDLTKHEEAALKKQKRELRKALRDIVANFNGGENPERRVATEGDFKYNSPSAAMVDSELILNAIDVLKRTER